MKIVFLSRSMDYGGAERQLATLAMGLKERSHDVCVSVLYGGGALEQRLRESNIRLIDLHKKGRWDVTGFLLRLAKMLRREQPDVIYSFLPIQNLLAGILSPLCRPAHIVWGVRASGFDLSGYDWMTRHSYLLERRLSGLPDLIIVNSQAGLSHMTGHGVGKSKLSFIANGIDCERYRADTDARRETRAGWHVGDGEQLVGWVARFDPLKDPHTFFRAAAQFAATNPSAKFVCVGDGPTAMMQELTAASLELGLEQRLVWAGRRDDMPAVYNALDLFCLSSVSEGFPNVVAEAMACGVRCVVTDVGDAAAIVGETGLVVPPRQPEEMAAAIGKLLDDPKTASLPDPRARVLSEYNVDAMVKRTEAALETLLHPFENRTLGS